jgi:hypothetical protein
MSHVASAPLNIGFADDHDERCLRQREANRMAHERGSPLPYPNRWDVLDPTKAPPGATEEQIAESYREFRRRCPPPATKRYVI